MSFQGINQNEDEYITMVKSELILSLSYKLDHLSPADLEFAVNFILEEMARVLSSGGRIEVRGFGTFSVRYRKARRAHNPRTGMKVATPSKFRPHFKPGKLLRMRVDKNREKYPLKVSRATRVHLDEVEEV